MVKNISLIVLLVLTSFSVPSQTIEKVVKLQSSTNSFHLLNMGGYPFFAGITSNGHIYTIGMNYKVIGGRTQPTEYVRIDLTSKSVAYKPVTDTNTGMFAAAMNSAGAIFQGVSGYSGIHINKLEFKDSIKVTNLGNLGLGNFGINTISLGLDGNMYVGGGQGNTHWGVIDSATNALTVHPEIDIFQDYIFKICGDTNWVYCEVGQKDNIYLYAVRKADDYKKLLFQIANTGRFNLRTQTDGIKVQISGRWYKLKDSTVTESTVGKDLAINETDQYGSYGLQKTLLNFDPVNSKLFFSIDDSQYDSLNINTSKVPTKVRCIFSFKGDTNNIYYTGDYYGNYYRYNREQDTTYLLGSSGYNIYSTLQLDSNRMLFGNYPSGALLVYNRDKSWTTGKFLEDHIISVNDSIANPKLIGYFKQTPAGFHHLISMIKDYKNRIIGIGDVIRLDNTCSIGSYDPLTREMRGYSYKKILHLSASSICAWKNKIIFATNNKFRGVPKLYVYDPDKNIMCDSLNFGFTDYGKVTVVEDQLTGIANNRIYKLNLRTKKLIDNYEYPENSIKDSRIIEDGSIFINTTNNLPKNFGKFIPLEYSIFFVTDKKIYAVDNKMQLLIIRNL